MGGSASKEQNISKSTNPNGKTVKLLTEICSSWGFGSKADNVKTKLIKELNNQGYNVDYTFEPMAGGNGEFFIYETSNNKKRCVFANSKNVGDGNTVVGFKITDKNFSDIIQNILSQ